MPAEILPAFFRKKPRCWQKFQHTKNRTKKYLK